jgi:ATP-dependent RNA helicase RhlE
VSFESLGLAPELLRAVADQGYAQPTAVQREAIPLILDGRDLLAGAQTGTGKTAAFVLPILQRLADSQPVVTGPTSRDRRDAYRPPVRVLILTPTRELALQVEASIRTYGAHRRVRSTAIYGGVGFEPQVRALRAAPSIVVATPGRLLDHATQRTIDLSQVEVLVLDEADRMLDMGFIRDIRRVLDLLPARRQNLLFSATFSEDIRRLASGLLQDPATVQVTPRNTATELVTQLVHPVDRHRKRELLSHLIRSGRIEQALVFTRTKHGANHLAEQLQRDGIAATAIHGNKSQGQRIRALDDFKAGRARILVATEVASRGLDIEDLPHVVNFELPMVAEDYVHRIGRTGRAGATGDAISLVCVDEHGLLREIESLLRQRIPSEVVEGFEPDRSIRPEPIRRGSQPQRAPAARGHGRPSGARGAPERRPGTQVRPTDRPWSNHGQAKHVQANRGPAPHGSGPASASSERPRNAARDRHEARPASPWPRSGGPRSGNHPARGDGGPRRSRPGTVGIGNAPVPSGPTRPNDRRRDRHPSAQPRSGSRPHQHAHQALPGERFRRSKPGR